MKPVTSAESAAANRPEVGVAGLLCLPGRQVAVIHGSRQLDSDGGGDIDLVVQALDPWWPLRVPPPWRFCQRFDHDVTGSYWVLDREGETVAIDTLDDEHGIGKYRFPTGWAFRTESAAAQAATRAVYLTSKRIRKGNRDQAAWEAVRHLAERETRTYERLLSELVGRRTGRGMARAVLGGAVPLPGLRRRWRAALLLSRLAAPRQLCRMLALTFRRLLRRALWPTGLSVLIVGCDGTGKSSLAGALNRSCAGLFRRDRHVHWRPGVLPRPGALAARPARDATAPHGAPPRSRLVSLALLAYHWLDFLLGSWLVQHPLRARSALVVVERGFWDLAVDPRRYRLAVPRSLVLALGRLLPRPDLVLRLEASPEAILTRKAELPAAEIERQLEAWRTLRCGRRTVALDASRPLAEVVEAARAAIVETLEARAVRRLGAGWAALPSQRSARWLLPRGPRRVAAGALALYQPVTRRSLAGWHAAQLVARAGGFRLLRRGEAPPPELRRLLAPHLPPCSTFAVARANHPGRYLALVVGDDGEPRMVVKVALDRAGRAALAREAEALRLVGPKLPEPLVAPALLDAAPGVLVVEYIPWRPCLRPWAVPREVAGALGLLYRELGGDAGGGPAHGDFAPWNLLRTEEGWALVDWEGWRERAEPFADLAHYLRRSVELLGCPHGRTLRRALAPGGALAGAAAAFAEGACLEADLAVAALRRAAAEGGASV